MKRFNKLAFSVIALVASAGAAMASTNVVQDLQTAATDAISTMNTALGIILVAGFVIVITMLVFRLVKRGLSTTVGR